jgi:ribonucleoside-diphosphate reductase alpha chain
MTSVISAKKEEKPGNKRPDRIIINHAPKRPQVLPCDVYTTQIKGDKWTVFVGTLDGYPFEIFAGLYKGKLPERGTITKVKSKTYLFGAEGIEPIDILEAYGESGSYLYSKMLQHGVPLWSLIDLCSKINESVLGFNKAMGRTIKKYMEDSDTQFMKCDICKSDKLSFQEGCLLCLNCGTSKCQ